MAVSLLVLAACRVEVTAELDLAADGSGTAALELFLDREVLGLLDELAVDALDEVEAVVRSTDGWDLEVTAVGADGLDLRLEHTGDDPAGALAELADGLIETDPALHLDLEVAPVEPPDAPSELHVTGRARLQPPVAAGLLDEDGEPVGPDAQQLAALVEDHVSAEVVLAMPGEVQATNATRRDDGTLVWELPVGEDVEVSARAVVSTLPVRGEVLLAGAAVLVAVTVGIVLVLRRRR